MFYSYMGKIATGAPWKDRTSGLVDVNDALYH